MKAQQLQTDVVKIMTYNVGDYGKSASGTCPLLNLVYKNAYLKTVLRYENPDIIGVEKMSANSFFATSTIVHSVLDSICNGCYGNSTYTNLTGDNRTNMLYYNTNKFGFVSTTSVYTGDPNISDINITKLYYKSANISSSNDTIFINFVLVHLLSGSSNSSSRSTEANGVMNWLNSHINSPENIIVMGDFNTQSSSEGCFSAFINSTNNSTKFFDPPNQLGNWSSFSTSFAHYLTQSTRTNDPGDCLATGGITNRFDHILCNNSIMNGLDSIAYIPGSYQVVGQDGQHTGHSLIDAPINTVVPANVDSALYFMSEHLPVTLNLGITYTVYAGINEPVSNKNIHLDYTTTTSNTLSIYPVKTGSSELLNICEVSIYNSIGSKIYSSSINLYQENEINVSSFAEGMYFLLISKNNSPLFKGKFVKQ